MSKFTRRDYALMVSGACAWQLVLEVDEWHLWGIAAFAVFTLLQLWSLPNGWNLRISATVAWQWLKGWLPVTVWLVSGPPGGGPWFLSPEEAAEFIREESKWVADEDHEEKVVLLSPESIDALRRRLTDSMECDGWRIKRITIPRREIDREWGGW